MPTSEFILYQQRLRKKKHDHMIYTNKSYTKIMRNCMEQCVSKVEWIKAQRRFLWTRRVPFPKDVINEPLIQKIFY